MDFAVALVLLVVLSLLHGVHFAWSAVYAPLPLALLLMTVTGMGLWTSAMGVQYRDIRHAVPFLMQLLLYAAPVVWPASLIDENFPDAAQWIRPVYGLYPMAGVVEGFRAALFGATPMPWDLIGVGFCVAALLCVTGARYFRRMERVLADVA